jgi:hypothetical protein
VVSSVLGSSLVDYHLQLQSVICRKRRSRWSRGLRHELSSLARKPGPMVRIPLEAWLSVCVYSVFVLSKDSYRLCIGSRNWKSGQGPTKGCRGIIIIIIIICSKRIPRLVRNKNCKHPLRKYMYSQQEYTFLFFKSMTQFNI